MASGKALGEFSFKAVTIKYSPGPAGRCLVETNWEGTATGIWSSLWHGYLRRWSEERNFQFGVRLHTWTMATVLPASSGNL